MRDQDFKATGTVHRGLKLCSDEDVAVDLEDYSHALLFFYKSINFHVPKNFGSR